jgi:hypothetical protein
VHDIVALTIAKFPANPHQKYGAQIFGYCAFTPFCIQSRIAAQQLFAVHEVDLRRQEGRQAKLFAHRRFGCFDPGIDGFNR